MTGYIANVQTYNRELTSGDASTLYGYGPLGGSGVTITGSPTSGQIPIASSGTAASWQTLKAKPVAFASLDTCNSGAEGKMMGVTDSNTNTWGATVAAGGANHILAYCNGTNWTVAAK
jgi:hypothetical protein